MKNPDSGGKKRIKQPWNEEVPSWFSISADEYRDYVTGSLIPYDLLRQMCWVDHQRRLHDPQTCANCGKRHCGTEPYWTGYELIKACQECVDGWNAQTLTLPKPKKDKRQQYIVVLPGSVFR